MKIRCDICKKKVSKEEMLWAIDENRDICKECYSKEWKEGRWKLVMPHLATIDWGDE